MRATEADKYRKSYLEVCAARTAIRSPALAIEGTSSACCGVPTFERFDEWLCVQCFKVTKPKAWASCASGSVSRGGWDPGRQNGIAAHGARDQVAYVNETRNARNGDGEFARLERNRAIYAPLAPLFVRPAGSPPGDWERSLFAWDTFLYPGLREWNPVAAISVAVERGAASDPEPGRWSRDNARVWIQCARRVVRDRVIGGIVSASEGVISQPGGPWAA